MENKEKLVNLFNDFAKKELGTNFNEDILKKFADYFTANYLDLQKTEIDILIRKKEVLRNEISELQAENKRLKEIEYMYNSLLK